MNKISQKINKAKGLPIDKLAKKISEKAYNKIFSEIRNIQLIIKPPNVLKVKIPRYKTKSNFFINDKERENIINKIEKLEKTDEIIEQANQICCHEFDLLGSGKINLGKSIPWNKDFKVNYVWPNKYYKKIQIVDSSNNADVKVPWELSRFQHIFTLGKAYWISRDEKYSQEFVDQIRDWLYKNPFEMTVNWTCTMDVAIRAVNWITGYYFFKDSLVIKEEFWKLFNNSLYQHGKYIINNLENKGNHTGNHYLSNIVGLAWLGIYFEDLHLKHAIKKNQPSFWLEFALKELEKELFIQVNADGTNYEASTSYHRLVAELFLITTILCERNKFSFSSLFYERLEKMFEFLLHLTKPNGLSPIVGDADDGRLIIISSYSKWQKNDFRHLLAIAGEYFDRDDFRFAGRLFKEDAIWIHSTYKETSIPFEQVSTTVFPQGGYYILKNKNIYCCIRCGELSFRGEGVHSHNDQLSFDLTIKGEDFIVDPGSYIYTADYAARNLYRSTSMHNTLQIDNFEQNDFNVYELFSMKEQTFSKCEALTPNSFVGEHYGYTSKSNHVHSRNFSITNNCVEIVDKVKSVKNTPNKYVFKYYFTLDSCVTIQKANNKALFLKKGQVEVFMEIEDLSDYEVRQVEISKSYGTKEQSHQIIISTYKNTIKTKFKFLK
ncbi:alginate lyase family protein [Priestia aryabhattai]|uniref:alginate lyase family protein n=1 Tax=Priestia aryabhattai TaxID=412384 RepID=UPI001CBDFF51|nr:alginate lyase family protein [Priestia aryabhattai]